MVKSPEPNFTFEKIRGNTMIDLYYVGLVQWTRNGDIKTVCIARDFKTCETLLNQWLSEDGNGETHENYGISTIKADFVNLNKPAS